jgi:hypothetical protein
LNSDYQDCVKQLKRELTFLQKEVQACVEEGDFKFAKYYQKAMWCTQWQLDRLNSFTGKIYYLDQQEIDNALIELNEGTIAGFSILFQPFQDMYLHFSLTVEKEILCQLPTKEELEEFYGYPSKLKKHIGALGFVNANPDNRLRIQFKLPTNKSCIDIKEKLSLQAALSFLTSKSSRNTSPSVKMTELKKDPVLMLKN